jgi:hypothetical protein
MRTQHIAVCGLSVRLHNFLPHYLINGNFFDKKIPSIKGGFSFSLQLLSESLLFLKRTERKSTKHVYRSVSMYSTVMLYRFKSNLNFLDRFSKKHSNIKFHKFVGWEPSCSMRTDRREEANSWFSEFCERDQNGWIMNKEVAYRKILRCINKSMKMDLRKYLAKIKNQCLMRQNICKYNMR